MDFGRGAALTGGVDNTGVTEATSQDDETAVLDGLPDRDGVVWKPPHEQILHTIIRESDIPIPIRDGLELAANLYRPEADDQYSVIMGITGFGKDVYWGDAAEVFHSEDWPGEQRWRDRETKP